MSFALASGSVAPTAAAPVASPSTAVSLSVKIEELEQELKELKGKITKLDDEIVAAEKAQDVAAAARLRNDRQELKEDAKQLRAQLMEYQREKNLLLEAQQRMQQQQ